MKIASNLLREIAHCPNVHHCLAHPDESHHCSTIVQTQRVTTLTEYQVPEPWSGHLDQVPVLFLSSNPSISSREEYPRWSWSDERIQDYFINRFGGGRKAWIKDGSKTLYQSGDYGRATAFWAAIRQRAAELMDREVTPGEDYALTEIVHCKSKSESGVVRATHECVPRYFQKVLQLAAAKVIVVLGKQARHVVEAQLSLPAHKSLYGPTDVYGRERLLIFLPHPNARQERTISKCLSGSERRKLLTYLNRI